MGQNQPHNTTHQGLIQDIAFLKQTYTPTAENVLLSFIESLKNISQGLLLITLHLPQGDLVATKLKQSSIAILDLSFNPSVADKATQSDHIAQLLALLQKAMGYVALARTAGQVSFTNSGLIERELLKVYQGIFVLSKTSETEESANVYEKSVEHLFAKNEAARSTTQTFNAYQPKVAPLGNTTLKPFVNTFKTESVAPLNSGATTKQQVVDNQGPHNASAKQTSSSGVDRQLNIINLIKDKKSVVIKDITVHFKDISEKTIQRDLQALVARDVLKKVGERRWARYSLK